MVSEFAIRNTNLVAAASDPPLEYLSATELLESLARRKFSPVELMEATIAAADAAERELNPFTARYGEEAMVAAAAAERRYRERRARPLEGIPVAVKELTPVAGQQHTLGSLALRDVVATETAPIAQRLRDAGAILHARTTTPEFGCASVTRSRLYGETRNPWNTDLSPAGSSGGSAAALAVGATTLATGTDSAGSLRLPAAACGVVGMKPSFGVIPVAMPLGLETTHHDGPMARTVADAALMLATTACPSADAPAQSRPAPRLDGLEEGVEGWSVALLAGITGLDVDADVAGNLLASAELLSAAGARVEEVDLGWSYESIIEATKLHYAAAYGPMVQRLADEVPELLTPYALAFAAEVDRYGARPGFVLEARERIAALWAPLRRQFERHRLLLCPTLAFPAPELGEDYVERGPVVAGREQADRWIVGTTVAFNLMSWCPAISVPSGLAGNGVPTGAQLVGRPYADGDVLCAAATLEARGSWPDPTSLGEAAWS